MIDALTDFLPAGSVNYQYRDVKVFVHLFLFYWFLSHIFSYFVVAHVHTKDYYIFLNNWPLYNYAMLLFSLITFLALKSALYEINIVTHAFELIFALYLSTSVSFYFKWISHIDNVSGFCFLPTLTVFTFYLVYLDHLLSKLLLIYLDYYLPCLLLYSVCCICSLIVLNPFPAFSSFN